MMTYETTGIAHGKAIPFLPMLRLFRAFFGITEQDSEATASSSSRRPAMRSRKHLRLL